MINWRTDLENIPPYCSNILLYTGLSSMPVIVFWNSYDFNEREESYFPTVLETATHWSECNEPVD